MKETCKRHEGIAVIGKCLACGEPLCRECRDEFGYFCSRECLEKSRSSVDPESKAKTKLNVEKGMRLERILGLSFKIAGGLLLLGIAIVIWSVFLSPYGKLSWSWKGEVSPAREFIRLDAKGGRILLFNGPFATILDTAKGQPKAGAKGEELQRLEHFDGRIGSATLLHGDSCAGLLDDDCALLWFKDFKGRHVLSVAGDQAHVIILLAKDYGDKDDEADAKSEKEPAGAILCIRADNGATVWTRPLPPGESASHLCAADGRFAYLANAVEKNEYVSLLKVCDSATGEAKWQVRLKGHSYTPPLFAGEALIFTNGGTLNAVSADGSAKLWSVKLGENGFIGESSLKPSGGKLVFPSSKGIACADVKERKIDWERSLDCDIGDLIADNGRVFILGCTKAPAVAPEQEKPSTMEDLKDSELTPAGLMGKAVQGFKKNTQILMALDVNNGNELWRKEGITGRLVCGDGKVALMVDTAKDLMISVISGSMKGETGITQLSASSGKQIASGTDKTGLTSPLMICGDKLVGVVYDREGPACVLGMGKTPPIRHLGLAAFKLK